MTWPGDIERHRQAALKKHSGNVYLGNRVKDSPPEGLSSVRETEDICDAILRDYKTGKISKQTANGRLALMENTVVAKAPHLQGKRSACKDAVRKRREKLKMM